jgi:hypothetical protein
MPQGVIKRRTKAMRRTTMMTMIVLLACTGQAPAAQQKTGLDEEGFITTWLLLAPIPLEPNQSGADAITREQIKGEAKLQPRAGDKAGGSRELTWKEYKAKDFFFDFNDFLGKQTEDSVGYAVCYIHTEAAIPNVKLKIGSDDQAKIYLNGKEVLKQDQARALDKDQDSVDVALDKGVNVLVFKVVNEKIDWSGCARFTDKDGNVLKDLKATTSPKPGEGKSSINDEGFITAWLLLAPIPLEPNQSGADAVGKEQIKDEAKLQPRAGDKAPIGKELAWKEYKAKQFFFDFNDFLGGLTEDSVGYAVCYIHADAAMPNLKLKISSDDQARIYLNGKEVLKQDQARALDKDQDSVDVSLDKGVNVLVFKVVNEKGDWSGCARFTDKDGQVVKNLKITTAPK